MSGRAVARVEEDLSQNRFLQILRASFEGIYQQAARRGERTVILVPCAECEAEHFDQLFAETHLLQASAIPGCYMNLVGQGVEIKDSSVATQLGFQEHRVCEVLQSESMYDLGNTFKVLVIDKPLIGRHKPLPGAVDRAKADQAPPDELLMHAPVIQGEFFDQVDRFRKTFIQVPGCENRTAERIRDIVTDAVQKLAKFHKLSGMQLRQLEFTVSRQAYTALHSFIFPHLQAMMAQQEERLQQGIRSYPSLEELLQAIPEGGDRLRGVDISESSQELELMDGKIAPHEKVECIDKAHSLLQKCIADSKRSAPGSAPLEITGDDVLALFILVIYRSQVKSFLAHVCHVEMYIQGLASRCGGSDAARFEEAGYAVSALQAGLQFFLEEGRSAAKPGSGVFSHYLGGPGGEEAPHLQGLVRSARAQAMR